MRMTLKELTDQQLLKLWGTSGVGRNRRIAAELVRRGSAVRVTRHAATHTIEAAGCYNEYYIKVLERS